MLIRRIRELLYGQGFTISGARNLLENPNQPDSRSVLPASALNVSALRHENQGDHFLARRINFVFSMQILVSTTPFALVQQTGFL